MPTNAGRTRQRFRRSGDERAELSEHDENGGGVGEDFRRFAYAEGLV